MNICARNVFWLSLFLLVTTASAQWVNVGPGIDYQKFTTADPNHVYVARMEASNTNCTIASMIASNRVAGAREIVSSQASRYEDSLSYWGQAWGQRNDVVVAINGSFFNGTSGIITGGHIQDGWFAKRFDQWSGQTGFVWKFNRSYFIGVCPYYVPNQQTVTIGGASATFDGINIARGTDQLMVYTPHYNNNTLTDASGVEVVVELPGALWTPNSTTTGTIKQVRVNQGSTSIPFDCIVLSGAGTAATFLQTYAQVGGTVSIGQTLQLYDGPLNSFCSNADSRNFQNAYALTQGNWVFLKNGLVLSSTDPGMTNRNPRTAVAYNSTYVFYLVCDGRGAGGSVGMSSDELAAFCKNVLGATDGVNMDGGGSSVMWLNGVVQNVPSDGSERAVANGLMMVRLQPKLVSTRFTSGQVVTNSGAASVRLGPGTDYYAFATLPSGTIGTITSHSVNGVYAKGLYWWKCAFGSTNGWVAEGQLNGAPGPLVTQQPADQLVAAGQRAAFVLTASGSNPLGYRWQKNSADLADGGHYSGALTSTLTVTNVDATDVGTYRCVITNAYASATSSPAALLLATNATGVSLSPIPTLTGDTTGEARAITPDGQWVAGLSGSRGFLHSVGSASAINVLSSDGAQATVVTGVGYRTVAGQQEVLCSGLSGGYFTTWMTANGGSTWGAKLQVATGKKPTLPLANSLAGTGSDVFFSVWTDEGTAAGDNWGLSLGKFSNAWPASVTWAGKSVAKPSTLQMNSVSSNGRSVGWRQDGTTLVYGNYVGDWNGAGASAWYFNGLDGTTAGQAYCVSANGTIVFGFSPKGAATGSTNYGYKATFNSVFPGTATQLSIKPLPNFPNTTGASTLAIPFGCTADGHYAAGMSYRGLEKAVLWDTRSTNSSQWTVIDLTDVAAAAGVLNPFSRLTRAYGVGTNATGAYVVVGAGLDTNSPTRTRGFIMTLPPPLGPIAFPPTLKADALQPTGMNFTFFSPSGSGLRCYLEYTTNLALAGQWTTVTSAPSTGAFMSLGDPTPADQPRFYRVRLQ